MLHLAYQLSANILYTVYLDIFFILISLKVVLRVCNAKSPPLTIVTISSSYVSPDHI